MAVQLKTAVTNSKGSGSFYMSQQTSMRGCVSWLVDWLVDWLAGRLVMHSLGDPQGTCYGLLGLVVLRIGDER